MITSHVWFDDWRWTKLAAELRRDELERMYRDEARDIEVRVDRMFSHIRRWRVRVWIIEPSVERASADHVASAESQVVVPAGKITDEMVELAAAALEEHFQYRGFAGTRMPGTEKVDCVSAARAVLEAVLPQDPPATERPWPKLDPNALGWTLRR